MTRFIKRLVSKWVSRGYVTDEQAPWLSYALERRIVGCLVGIPFWLVGIFLSTIEIASAFLISFHTIRVRSSGFHAKNLWVCLGMSVLLECLFLGVLIRVMNGVMIFNLMILSSLFIIRFAPFRCQYIHLSDEELEASAMGTKIRVFLLLCVYFLLSSCRQKYTAYGIGLGIVMAALLLALAYLKKGREVNEY